MIHRLISEGDAPAHEQTQVPPPASGVNRTLGVDFRNYVILGACNPPLAYKTLQQEINIGLLLPCNFVVYEADEAGKSVVAAIDAKTMLSVI